MQKPKITNQVFYAKGFYQHTGNIINDMKQVCKLDMPSYDFSSPWQILKFMRKQYNLWLDQNPEITRDKNGDNKVAWESDPIKAEIWHILIAYQCYIPMTNIKGFIDGLPRYDVMKPQYNAGIYNFMRDVFSECKTKEQLIEKAKKVLNMPNTEIMDTIADRIMQTFSFKKASKLLSHFGETITAAELDDELWDLYSNIIGYNLEDDETIKEKYLYSRSKHFSIEVCPKFGVNSTMNINVNLVPMRWEHISDVDITSENFVSEYLKACDAVLDNAIKDFPHLAELAENVFTDDTTIWEAPAHMHDTDKMAQVSKEILHDYLNMNWVKFDYNSFINGGEYDAHGVQTGCFGVRITNENGKMKVTLELHTLWESGCFEHCLHNYNQLLISSPAY